MSDRALITVDGQNDFCPGGALPVKEGDQIVGLVNRVRAAFQEIILTRDWHKPNSKHFKINNPKARWNTHCVENTWGAEFHPDLIVANAIIISKGMDPEDDGGYSGFEGFTKDGKTMAEYLRDKEVTEIYIGGLATDYCVKATALDAVKNGFKTFLLLDACRAVNLNPGDGEKAIQEMKEQGVIITSTKEVLDGKR